MKIVRCDRCGAEKIATTNLGGIGAFMPRYSINRKIGGEYVAVDLCKTCEEELDIWFKSKIDYAKWVYNEEESKKHVEPIYNCSNCNHRAWGDVELSNFCPDCGKIMNYEEEEEDGKKNHAED